ncbi:MAG: M43 family zinc metalloprotease [Bacteroidota bacterium]|nr:M43 family zinc metalloprotease [Bacteroidota bacterium]
MKIKHLLTNSLLGLALVAGLSASAQNATTVKPCITYEAMDDVFAKDPKAKARYEKTQSTLQKEYLEYEANKAANKMSAPPVYTVPVVFHILHQGGPENVPDANCIAALNWVNLDFARANFDAGNTVAPFNASYIDSEIKFMLAKKDPNGNCTTGIIHHVDAATSWSQATHSSKSVYTWDPTKYLNVYIVQSIAPTTTVAGGGFIVGYTFKPGTHPTGSQEDIIVFRYDYLTGGDNARTLSHEVGHWLNLAHIWGNTNAPNVACGDDGITDTPVTRGHEFTCPTSSANTCVQTNTVYNNLDNVQNIMNYANCTYNFTTGQTNAMRTSLVSASSGRNNLPTAGNLTATDVNGAVACAPTADFMSIAVNGYTVCAGQSISLFKDVSYGAPVLARIWTATNGATITTPTGSSTVIWFPTPGISVVSYSVTGAAGGSTASRTITVLDGAATATNGITESFEGSGVPPNWSVENPNGIGWVQTSNAALHGSFSFILDGAISSSGSIDVLNMPIMDFAANPGATLRFSYAYRQKSASHADVFKVQLSSDCGGTWKDVYAPSATALAFGSGGVGASNFIPTLAEWKTQDVSGHPNYGTFVGSNSVWARFYFKEATGGFGNKLYLDSINLVTAPVGVNELTRHLRLTLSPNPTNASATLNFILSNQADVKVIVMDVAGKLVSPEKAYTLAAGDHKITLNENGTLNKGIYIVSLEYNGTKLARKLIIE